MKLLFVCLGNICRSPLAEALFVHKIKEKGLEHTFSADSCGTSDYNIGLPPDERTIRSATINGIAIRHLGRQIETSDLEKFDLILAMDQRNYHSIILLSNGFQNKHKIRMMRDFDPNGSGDVPDPYSGGERMFQEVFEILDRSVGELIDRLARPHP